MIADVCRKNLMALATSYQRATGNSLEYVSKTFYGNRKFLDEFKRGKCSLSIKKFDEMVELFRKEWPDTAEWPYLDPIVLPRPKKVNLSPK